MKGRGCLGQRLSINESLIRSKLTKEKNNEGQINHENLNTSLKSC